MKRFALFFVLCYFTSAANAATPATAPATPPAATQPACIFQPLDARRIIFISDCSGSLMQKFDPLRAEMRNAIRLLRPEQHFDIIFMQSESASILSRALLIPATNENKQKADDFMTEIAPRGATEPFTAFRLAFALKPDAIFLITDGDFQDNDALAAEVKKLNVDKKVKVNTVAFFDRGETYEKFLAQLAKDNGGTYRFVAEEDSGR